MPRKPQRKAAAMPGSRRARKTRKATRSNISHRTGDSRFHGVKSSFDVSGNSLRSPQIPTSIPFLSGGDGGILGIQGSSKNWYLDNLIDPSRAAVRMPDLYSKRTALHKQVMYGTLTPNVSSSGIFNSAANCFAITLNPYIGTAAGTSIQQSSVTTNVGDGTTGVTTNYIVDSDLTTLAPLVDEIRPVSAFIYVSFVGDTLNDGGQIAGAFLPSGSLVNQTYPVRGTTSMADVSNLSVQPGAYTGPVSKGVYVRWQPEDERDSFFYNVGGLSQAEAYNFPKLVVAGVTTQNAPNIRWIAQINYEFTTQSRLFSQLPSPIAPRLIEHAKSALQSAPYAVANDEHASLWSRFLDWAKGAVNSVEQFYENDIKPVLAPALGIGSKIAGVVAPEFAGPLNAAASWVASH